jgi:hypothetical protein
MFWTVCPNTEAKSGAARVFLHDLSPNKNSREKNCASRVIVNLNVPRRSAKSSQPSPCSTQSMPRNPAGTMLPDGGPALTAKRVTTRRGCLNVKPSNPPTLPIL